MKSNYLGIDLGGTNTKIGIGPLDGDLLHTGSIDTKVEAGPQAWVDRVAEAVRAWKSDFVSVGVGSPGPLDIRTGTILSTPNLKPFIGFSMKAAFEKAFGKPVRFENDANVGALGEFYFGAHKKNPNMVVLTLGTGVGSGVVAEGRLVRGHQGYATELGHMVINFDNGPKCLCGKRGCFEAYVGARNTIARYFELNPAAEPTHSLREVFRRALDSSDDAARKIYEEWIQALAVGLANTITIFNPGVIILTGGITEGWANIKPKLLSEIEPMVDSFIRNSTLIEISNLGQYFGVHGAIALSAEKTVNG
ncbi:MAG: ROK family protein [Bdellovibrionia bacterium]